MMKLNVNYTFTTSIIRRIENKIKFYNIIDNIKKLSQIGLKCFKKIIKEFSHRDQFSKNDIHCICFTLYIIK